MESRVRLDSASEKRWSRLDGASVECWIRLDTTSYEGRLRQRLNTTSFEGRLRKRLDTASEKGRIRLDGASVKGRVRLDSSSVEGRIGCWTSCSSTARRSCEDVVCLSAAGSGTGRAARVGCCDGREMSKAVTFNGESGELGASWNDAR